MASADHPYLGKGSTPTLPFFLTFNLHEYLNCQWFLFVLSFVLCWQCWLIFNKIDCNTSTLKYLHFVISSISLEEKNSYTKHYQRKIIIHCGRSTEILAWCLLLIPRYFFECVYLWIWVTKVRLRLLIYFSNDILTFFSPE